MILSNIAMSRDVQVKFYSLASGTFRAGSTSASPHRMYFLVLGVGWHLRKRIDLLHVLLGDRGTARNGCEVPLGGVLVERMLGDESVRVACSRSREGALHWTVVAKAGWTIGWSCWGRPSACSSATRHRMYNQ